MTIDHCHLVIINTFPINIESQVNNHPAKNVSCFQLFVSQNFFDSYCDILNCHVG